MGLVCLCQKTEIPKGTLQCMFKERGQDDTKQPSKIEMLRPRLAS